MAAGSLRVVGLLVRRSQVRILSPPFKPSDPDHAREFDASFNYWAGPCERRRKSNGDLCCEPVRWPHTLARFPCLSSSSCVDGKFAHCLCSSLDLHRKFTNLFENSVGGTRKI